VVIEHTFATTSDAAATFDAARRLLAEAGYIVESSNESLLDARRGKKTALVARCIEELPQRVHLAFDRGRVDLAVMAEIRGKPKPLHKAMLMIVALGLEDFILRGDWLDANRAEFDATRTALAGNAKTRRRWGVLFLTLVLTVLLPIVLLLIVSLIIVIAGGWE
jgi:hypothetical protein